MSVFSFLRESIDEASRQFDIIGCLLASIVKMFFAIICLLTWLNKLPIVWVDSNAAASFVLQCCLAWLIWWWHDMKVISNGYDNELWVRNTLQKLIIRTYCLLVSILKVLGSYKLHMLDSTSLDGPLIFVFFFNFNFCFSSLERIVVQFSVGTITLLNGSDNEQRCYKCRPLKGELLASPPSVIKSHHSLKRIKITIRLKN